MKFKNDISLINSFFWGSYLSRSVKKKIDIPHKLPNPNRTAVIRIVFLILWLIWFVKSSTARSNLVYGLKKFICGSNSTTPQHSLYMFWKMFLLVLHFWFINLILCRIYLIIRCNILFSFYEKISLECITNKTFNWSNLSSLMLNFS